MPPVNETVSKPTIYAEGNGDSGTTGHYLPISCEHMLLNVQKTASPIRVECPDGSIMVSCKTGVLNLPQLPMEARTCHIFPNINGALLSIGKFCDHGMIAMFDNTKLEIRNKTTNDVILTGKRDHRGMYMLPLTQNTTIHEQANSSIYSMLSNSRSCAKRVAFLSAALGNPADSTLLAAVKEGHLKSVPNITADQVRVYAPNSIESAKGHLDQAKQGTWSTKPKDKAEKDPIEGSQPPVGDSNDEDDARPTIMTNEEDDEPIGPNAIYIASECSSTLHGDLTGHYPVTSQSGNSKVLIGYTDNGRFIKSVAAAGDSSDDLIRAYDKLIKHFTDKGIVNEVIRIDNQTSADLQVYFEQVAKIKYRYVPPGNHRTLHAERDIRTWKNHFIATRAGVDKSFPANQWDSLLDQVDLTLNILRPCGLIPNMSAWEYVCGPYDYKTNPIGPAGAKVLVYENPSERETFADHGVEGFYVGPAWNHYRCFRVFIPSTRKFRISDTLSWHIDDPFGLLSNHSTIDALTDAINVLTVQLQQRSSTTEPDENLEQLRQGITALESIISPTMDHQTELEDDSPPPGFQNINTSREPPRSEATETSAVPVPLPRVHQSRPPDQPVNIPVLASGEPLPRVHQSRSPDQPVNAPVPASAEPLPRVQAAGKTTKPSRNLRSNKHHVIADPSPTVHNAIKIQTHKGSDKKPLNPLRFRVRWEGCTAQEDTWEPWDHVKDCKAATTYVNATPALWYLLEPALSVHKQFNAVEKAPIPWYKRKLREATGKSIAKPATPLDKPLTQARAQAIAQAVMSVQKFALYDLLGMPITQEMQHGLANTASELFANAAGDMDDDGNELKYKKCIIGPDKAHWINASITEFHRLFDKFKTIRMIKFGNIPTPKQSSISYYNPQCKTKIKPSGKLYRVRGTFGGDRSNYNGVTASYQAAMSTVKLLLNKNISIDDSRWMTMDVADMYLHSRLPDDQYEYMVLNIDEIPQEIIDTYHIMDYVSPGDTKAYVEVTGCLYGMKQAGYIANKDIVEHLGNNGYTQHPNTPCLFKHESDDIEFTLITDDFGVRYGNKAAADRLLSVMSRKYTMTHDWTGAKYAGFDILNDYNTSTRRCEISMKGYMAAVLKRFKINISHNVFSPEFFQPINYGSKDSQLTKIADTTPSLSAVDINLVQQIVGCILYYARGVDATMRPAVDHISMEQTNGTVRTMQKAIRLLEYGATFPDATIVYYPSDMILKCNVDGSYNSEPDARSRAGAFIYCGRTNDPNFINGPIECISTLIPTVVSSAAETEYASLFIGGKALLPLRYTLLDMNCIQPATEIITDNVAAKGIATNTCKQRRSKSMDMRYHWIRDRVGLKDFSIVWRPGSESIADYLTKTQPVANVLKMRKFFVKECPPLFATTKAKRQYFPKD